MARKFEDRFKEQKTYETFERDAKEAGLYDTFAQDDLDIAKQDVNYGYRLLDNKKGYVNADTEEGKQSFVDQAAFDRAQYQQKAPTVPQTSGKQSDASANILSIIKQYDDSLPGDKKSPWMSTIDSLIGQIAGDKFSYDAESDPKYALAQKYAEQAMKSQQAESAMLTGGYGNSHGAAVGQQVYTDYMEDAVTDMEQEAYNRWAAERDNKYNLLNIASQMEQQEYDRAENEQQWAYQTEQDAKEDARYQTEWDYQMARDAAAQTENSKASAQERILALLSMGGSAKNIPADLLTASGFTAEELAQYETYYKQQADADAATQADEDEDVNPFDFSEIYANLKAAGATDYNSAYRLLMGADYSEDEANSIAEGFESYEPKPAEDNSVDDVRYASREEAVEYVKACNVADTSGLLSPQQYNLRNPGTKTTYFEYVDDFIVRHGGTLQ